MPRSTPSLFAVVVSKLFLLFFDAVNPEQLKKEKEDGCAHPAKMFRSGNWWVGCISRTYTQSHQSPGSDPVGTTLTFGSSKTISRT